MFIQDDDVVEIKIFYKKSKRKQYIALTEKEFEILNGQEKKGYSSLSLKMKELTWGLHNALQEDAMVDNGLGERSFNYKIWKENKLRKLIKEWDAKDKDGKAALVTEQTIAHLSPNIAEAIIKAYDDIFLLGEEEEKKS